MEREERQENDDEYDSDLDDEADESDKYCWREDYEIDIDTGTDPENADKIIAAKYYSQIRKFDKGI